MADENYRSNRTGEAFARAAQPAYPNYAAPSARPDSAAGDPLAELARLIGQNDPFADFGRAPAQRNAHAAPAAAPAAHETYQHQTYDPQAYQTPAHQPQAYDAQAYDTQGYDTQAYHPPGQDYATSQALNPGYGAPHDQAFAAQAYNEPQYNDRYDQPAFDAPQAVQGQAYQAAHAQAYDAQGHAVASDAAATYQQQDPFYAGERPIPAYAGERQMPAASDDMYEEDAPPPRRRGGLGVVAAILALALVGTGAAYGYRTLFSGSSGSKAPPPVIRADGSPNKVVPPSNVDSQSGKMTDRIGEPGQGERVVSREEKPVDIKDAARAGQPRVIFPGPVANPNPSTNGSSALASVPSAPNTWAEPKKVRTETIRPDRPDRPVSTEQSAPPPAARSVAPAPTRTAAPAAAPVDSNAPLSLAPQNGQTQPPRTRTAAVPPAPAAAPAASSGGPGAYVQVSSRGSEADAQASFRQLQAKFPGQLGGQSATIRRADLGDKGVFFRAMVGPYATAEQATNMCVNLKAAGGQCVVQRN